MGRASRRKKTHHEGRAEEASKTPSLHISMVTGLEGNTSLANEVEHLKAALLYADEVTLYSPKNFMLGIWEHMRGADASALFAVLRQLDDETLNHAGGEREAVEQWAAIMSAPRSSLTASQRRTRRSFESSMMPAITEMRATAERQLEESGAALLLPAVEAGVLTFHPILQDEDLVGDFTDAMIGTLLTRIEEILSSTETFPSMDDDMASLSKLALEEGRITAPPSYERRARYVGLGLGLVGRLPHFPAAEMSEILDVRRELDRPLGTFRRGVSTLAGSITVRSDDMDFKPQVDELYLNHVQPAIDEIEQLVRDDTSLKSIAERVVTDKAGAVAGLGTGSLYALAFGGGQPVLGGALAVAITGGTSTVRAVKAAHEAQRGLEANAFYFLYGANERLK